MKHRALLLSTALLAGILALAVPRAEAAPACSVVEQVSSGVNGTSGSPAVDADGSRIVFRSNRDLTGDNADLNFELFLRDRAAGTLTQITDSTGSVALGEPSIDDAGAHIAFSSDRDLLGTNADLGEEVFVYTVSSSTLSQRTSSATDTVASENPAISGNGSVVALVSSADLTAGNPDGTAEIFRVNATGAPTFTRLTGSPTQSSFSPAVNQTGSRIAFASAADLVPATGNADANNEIFVVDPGGPTIVQLTHTTGENNNTPSISDDGSRVFFHSQQDLEGGNADHNSEIYRRVITGGFTQLTHTAAGSSNSVVADTNGARLAFAGDSIDLPGSGASSDIYVTDLTANGISPVTDVPTGQSASGPDISDDGEVLAFSSNGNFLGTNPDNSSELFVARCGPKAARYTDVPSTNAFFGPVQWMAELGYATVPANRRYHPTDPATRRQSAVFLYNLAGRPAFTPPSTATFTDVPRGSSGFKQIEWLVDEGIAPVPGNHRFKPADPLARRQMASFLYNLAGRPLFVPPGTATFSDVPVGNSFRVPVEWLALEGIVTVPGNHLFHPLDPVKRGQLANFLHNFAVFARVDLS